MKCLDERLQLQVVHVQQRNKNVHSLGRAIHAVGTWQVGRRQRVHILREEMLRMYV